MLTWIAREPKKSVPRHPLSVGLRGWWCAYILVHQTRFADTAVTEDDNLRACAPSSAMPSHQVKSPVFHQTGSANLEKNLFPRGHREVGASGGVSRRWNERGRAARGRSVALSRRRSFQGRLARSARGGGGRRSSRIAKDETGQGGVVGLVDKERQIGWVELGRESCCWDSAVVRSDESDGAWAWPARHEALAR